MTGTVARLLRPTLAAGLKLLGVVAAAIEGFFVHNCAQHAAGIAYRILFSIAPLAIALVSFFGLVLRNAGLRQDVIDLIVDHFPFSPGGAEDVQQAITSLATPASAFGFLSLIVFVWAATGMMAAIRAGLEAAFGVTRGRPPLRGKLVDLALVISSAVLVLAVAASAILGGIARRGLGRFVTNAFARGTLETVIKHGVPLVVSALVVLLLYRFVPARRIRLRDGLVGALVTSVLLLGISLASDAVYTRATKLSVVYGSLSAALVFLYSVYLYACAVLFGAEVARAWAEPPSADAGPLSKRVKRVLRGLVRNESELVSE